MDKTTTPESRRQELFDRAKAQERHTVRDFMKKMKHIIAEGVEDAIIDAIVASMLAIGYALGAGKYKNKVFWGVVRQMNFATNRTSIKFIDFDAILYPMFDHMFEKKLTTELWGDIQAFAKIQLEKFEGKPNADEACIDRFKSIIAGVVPCGYVVEEDVVEVTGVEDEGKKDGE